MKRDSVYALLLFFAALILRIAFAIPGLNDPELLMRPDSATYLAPAQALLEHGIYGHETVPTALRVPLYPVLLLPWLWLDGGSAGAFCIIGNILLSSVSVPLIWMTCREFGLSGKSSLFGVSLVLLTPTAVALSPMFLSDGLFLTITALELFLTVKFIQRKRSFWLYLAAMTGGLGVLTRPLNLLWILPFLFTIVILHTGNWKIRLRDCLISLLLFLAMFVPWVFRNHAQGFGWRIDTVSADSLKHNAAVVESRVTGRPAQEFREEYDRHFRALFEKDPEHFATEDAKLTYQEKYLLVIIRKHPGAYLKGLYHPVNYVPDVPSFLENLGLSRSGQGTWDVIINHGLFAGIRHYFGGNYLLPAMLFPLCLLLLAGYLSGGYGFFRLILQKKWVLPLLFLPFGFYYMTVTGPVAYPRFSLPILPYLSLLAAVGFQLFRERKEKRELINTSERNF